MRLVLVCAATSVAACASRGGAPGTSLEGLAAALGRAAGGARVETANIRWQTSGGAIADATVGRWAVFLARAAGDDTRDVWRARVRTTLEGDVLDVGDAYDLTNTPLGDDHSLVVRGDRAAFATRAYGREQSVTLLDLSGEGAGNRAEHTLDRAMAGLTNLQQTGSFDGVGRVDLTLESPADGVGLVLGEKTLEASLWDRGDRVASREATVDLASGELVKPVAGVQGEHSIHLPKRFSHWAVDTMRAVPWIGPAPVAWMEDQALAVRDSWRRVTFHGAGDPTDVVASVNPGPPVLDTSEASVEEAHWPPARIPSIWKEPEKGEGEWVTPDVPWLRRVPAAAPDAPSAFYQTFVRPDSERPYAKVLLVAMDTRQLDLDMEAGVEDPEPLTGPHGTGRIPRDPAIYRRVAAAFNGAFKTEHGHYGMMVHKRVLLPPVPGSATVVVLDDGRVGLGTWGTDRKVGGIVGVDDDAIVSFRQNLEALIDRGQVNPTGRNLWGFTLPGKGAQTERSGLCVTTSGHLLYAWGDDISATKLAEAMKMGGCDTGMHLDMNPYHTGFLFTAIDDLSSKKYRSQLLTPGMSIPTDRYIQYAPKDFFYVLVHDPTPPAVDGAAPWAPDGGSQPPPHWLPGVWTTHAQGAQGEVQLLDVEAGRAAWTVRAGTQESPAASPLRELAGDDARRVILAVGAGIAPEKHPRGIATDGRLAVPLHGGDGWGAIAIGADGKLAIVRDDDVPPLDPAHGQLLEVPLLVWNGKPLAQTTGDPRLRSAIGVTPDGRVLVARGTFASAAPIAEVLARAGCVRAALLDRGALATSLLDRAGTPSPPHAGYEESVLYALARPLPPRAFRFEPATMVAQTAKSH
ncbi:MAG TPA: phosphodiester glycosidase family protein [Polyangiaceae bacterium]